MSTITQLITLIFRKESGARLFVGAVLLTGGCVVVLLLAGVRFGSVVSAPERTLRSDILLTVVAALLFVCAIPLLRRWEEEQSANPVHRPPTPLAEADYARVYEVSEAVEFYDLVAPFYDSRHSKDRERTNDSVHSACESYFLDLNGKVICDIGGGTGNLVRKFRHHELEWVNVDLSQKALDLFQQRYSDALKISARHFDACRGGFAGPRETFDIIILSFVLSSMPTQFPYKRLLPLMKDDAIFVIADNHPEYSRDKLYGYKDVNGKNYALRIRPIDPIVLQTEVEQAGFVQNSRQFTYTSDDKLYAQVQVFKKRPAPRFPNDHRKHRKR